MRKLILIVIGTVLGGLAVVIGTPGYSIGVTTGVTFHFFGKE